MKEFVTDILVPHFERVKARLRLPPSQKALYQLDVWVGHRSKEFRDWLAATYPWIILDFIPGGTTGKWQAADVGINRLFKHSVRRSFHEDMVRKYLAQIDAAKEKKVQMANIKFDRKLGSLRDESVGWIWDGWQDINDPALVKQVRLIYHRQNSYLNLFSGIQRMSDQSLGPVL
jgi:hypothetical protein